MDDSVPSALCMCMTDIQRQNIYRFRKLKVNQGWRFITLLLPAEVKVKVMDYKCMLMNQYHNSIKQ